MTEKSPGFGGSSGFLGGLPMWRSGKESACDAGDLRDLGLIHESGRSPGGGHSNPL